MSTSGNPWMSYRSLVKQIFIDLGAKKIAESVIEIGQESETAAEFMARLAEKGFSVPDTSVAALLNQIRRVVPQAKRELSKGYLSLVEQIFIDIGAKEIAESVIKIGQRSKTSADFKARLAQKGFSVPDIRTAALLNDIRRVVPQAKRESMGYLSLVEQIFVDIGAKKIAESVITCGQESKNVEDFKARLDQTGFSIPDTRAADLLNEIHIVVPQAEPESSNAVDPEMGYLSLVEQIFNDIGAKKIAESVIESGQESKSAEEFKARLDQKGLSVPDIRAAALLNEIHLVIPLANHQSSNAVDLYCQERIEIEIIEEDPEFLRKQKRIKSWDKLQSKDQNSSLYQLAKNHHTIVEQYHDLFENQGLEPEGLTEDSAQVKISETRPMISNEFSQQSVKSQVLMVVGEAASGKTTQALEYLTANKTACQGLIGCTQLSLQEARDVAERDPRPEIRYMDEFTLCNYIIRDATLSKFTAIVIDAAHERSLTTDVLFGLIEQNLPGMAAGDYFRLIIATENRDDVEKLKKYFSGNEIVVPSRRKQAFKVDIKHYPHPITDCLNFVVYLIEQQRRKDPPGVIVLFVSSQGEANVAVQMISNWAKEKILVPPHHYILQACSPLRRNIDPRVFKETPSNAVKVVISTAAAEGPLAAMDGVLCIIDTGFTERREIDMRQAFDAFEITRISQASAKRRSNLARHTTPGSGICHRLYSKDMFDKEMKPIAEPQILTANLGAAVIRILASGGNIRNFNFVDRPPSRHVDLALKQLYYLGALDQNGGLNILGKCMALLPLDPPWAKALVAGAVAKCRGEVLTIVAMAQPRCTLLGSREKQKLSEEADQFNRAEGDHLSLLAVYENWRAEDNFSPWCHEKLVDLQSLSRAKDLRDRLATILDNMDLLNDENCVQNIKQITRATNTGEAITSGLFFHAAQKCLQGDGYRTKLGDSLVHIHPQSVLFPQQVRPNWVIYNKLIKRRGKENMFGVMVIDPKWLINVAPTFFKA